MHYVFLLLFFACCAALLIGVIRPSWVAFWKGYQSRGWVVAMYGVFGFLFFVMTVAVPPSVDPEAETAGVPAPESATSDAGPVSEGSGGAAPAPHEGGSASPESAVIADDGNQPQRLKIIEEAIAKGIFMKVERLTRYPRLYVDEGFYTLAFDTKRDFVDVVLTYYIIEDPQADVLIIRDGYTGNEIGKFSRYGLDIY